MRFGIGKKTLGLEREARAKPKWRERERESAGAGKKTGVPVSVYWL